MPSLSSDDGTVVRSDVLDEEAPVRQEYYLASPTSLSSASSSSSQASHFSTRAASLAISQASCDSLSAIRLHGGFDLPGFDDSFAQIGSQFEGSAPATGLTSPNAF